MNSIAHITEIEMNAPDTFTVYYRRPVTRSVDIAHSIKSGRRSLTHELGRTMAGEKLVSTVTRTSEVVETEQMDLGGLVTLVRTLRANGRSVSEFNAIGVMEVA